MARSGRPGQATTPALLLLVLCLVAAGAAYLYTACPEPDWIDSGELSVAAHTLGIPHPTPKVLHVLWSRLAVVVLPGSFFPLTLSSALFVVCGLGLLARAARRLFPDSSLSVLPGILLLAASPLVWQQATSNEVHALQFLLFSCALWLWSQPSGERRALGITYVLCLSLFTHGTGLFLLPLWLSAVWPFRARLRVWIGIAITVVLAGSLILYLPIRSAQGPLLDWDHTADAVGLWHHLTAWSYQGLWASEAGSVFDTLARFRGGLHDTFPLPVWLITAVGLWRWALCAPRSLAVLLAVAAGCVGVSSLYAIADIDEYFLAAHLVCALLTCAGLAHLASRNRWLGGLGACVVLGSLAWSAPSHWQEVNRRNFRVPTDWVRDAMETVEPGGVVLTSDWDHYSAWMHLRVVEGFRPDATWIDLNLLRQSWYPEFLKQVSPGLSGEARAALDHLAMRVREFEAGQPVNDSALEASYVAALDALSFGTQGVVYADGVAARGEDWGVERVYLQGRQEVPWGLLTRLDPRGSPPPMLPGWPAYRNDRVPRVGTYRTLFHLELYDRARYTRATYEEAP